MGSGVSLRSFGVLLLFIGHSMVLVSGQFSSDGEKTVFDAKAKSGKTTLETAGKSLKGTFSADDVDISQSGIDVTFDFGGCEIKGKMRKSGDDITYKVGDKTMNFDLTFELEEDKITFAQKSGFEFPIPCSPTFTGDSPKYTIDVYVELDEAIAGMKFEFGAPQKKGSNGDGSGSNQNNADGAGLGGGWIALIVVGVLIVLAIIAFCVYWFWYRPKHKDDKEEAKGKRKGKRKLFSKGGSKRKPDDTDDAENQEEDDPAKRGHQPTNTPQQQVGQQVGQQQVGQQQVGQQQVPQLQVPQQQVPQLQVPQLQVPQLQVPQLQVPQLQVPQQQVGQQQVPQLQYPQQQAGQL
ncbi:hypothetical protein M3Y96_00410300 [Aphelenchoides besseyi]|nr:hypothetical protein M3Y96_00410300 [Aphelenchoides besseyi]